ncbi:MAG: hypothetical protein ACI4S2_12545 [Lachnospiraceae bacterium]
MKTKRRIKEHEADKPQEVRKKMKKPNSKKNILIRKHENCWRFRVGGVDGQPFRLLLRYRNNKENRSIKRFRLSIDLNTDRLIHLFGFNEKVIEF